MVSVFTPSNNTDDSPAETFAISGGPTVVVVTDRATVVVVTVDTRAATVVVVTDAPLLATVDSGAIVATDAWP